MSIEEYKGALDEAVGRLEAGTADLVTALRAEPWVEDRLTTIQDRLDTARQSISRLCPGWTELTGEVLPPT